MGRSQAPGVRVEPLCGRKSALTGYVWAMLEIPRNRLGLWAVSVFPVSGSSIPDLPVSWLLNSELFVALSLTGEPQGDPRVWYHEDIVFARIVEIVLSVGADWGQRCSPEPRT